WNAHLNVQPIEDASHRFARRHEQVLNALIRGYDATRKQGSKRQDVRDEEAVIDFTQVSNHLFALGPRDGEFQRWHAPSFSFLRRHRRQRDDGARLLWLWNTRAKRRADPKRELWHEFRFLLIPFNEDRSSLHADASVFVPTQPSVRDHLVPRSANVRRPLQR